MILRFAMILLIVSYEKNSIIFYEKNFKLRKKDYYSFSRLFLHIELVDFY